LQIPNPFWASRAGIDLAGNSISSRSAIPPNGSSSCAGLSDCIYDVLTDAAITTTPGHLLIQNQLQHIMDWTPRWTLQSLSDWTYNPTPIDDRQNMQVKFH